MKKLLLSLSILFVFASFSYADFTGKWLVESKKSIVDIQKCGDSLCGTIVWLKEPTYEDGTEKVDKENENETLRNRKIKGIKMIYGFRKEGNEWVEGKIYNPNDGKTYDSNMKLNEDGTLALDGCVWILCKTQTWTKAN
ncbi:MAG: DUF2147 domain-containing protein [Alphaproteobacteria bacterium]